MRCVLMRYHACNTDDDGDDNFFAGSPFFAACYKRKHLDCVTMSHSYAPLSQFSHIKNKFTPSAADNINTQTLVAPSEKAHTHPSTHSLAQIAGSQLGHYIHDMVLHYSMALINAGPMSGIEASVYESYGGFVSGKLVYFERFITGRRPHSWTHSRLPRRE